MAGAGNRVEAFFYPSRAGTLPVKVLGRQTHASHDLHAACHEQRHFVDRNWVAEAAEGEALLSSLVRPVPYCTKLTGTKRDERVLGMLAERLTVIVKPETGARLELRLDHVLVVDALPVPLHISVKALSHSLEEGSWSEEALHGILNYYNSAQGYALQASLFPEAYQQHPYWIPDGTIFMGVSDNMFALSEQLQRQAGVDQAALKVCQKCGKTDGKLHRCGRCMKVFYCSAGCQRSDWTIHKSFCTAPAPP